MLKVGDKVTMKLEGPWKQNDAYVAAGLNGIVTNTDNFHCLQYDCLVEFFPVGSSSFLWWISKEDTALSTAVDKKTATTLPVDAKGRKNIPIITGVFDYFPAALADVARVSKAGNDQHNPGQPLHWSRNKSNDHADCIGRHLSERGTIDVDGQRHSAKLAWRALALLQEELEAEGAPMARGASFDEEKK